MCHPALIFRGLKYFAQRPMISYPLSSNPPMIRPMSRFSRLILTLLPVLALLLATGCKSMTPGQLDWVQTQSDRPNAGNVYLLRGFIGIWSYGVDKMGEK